MPNSSATPDASSWILHHYAQSPVAQKVRFLLGLCGHPWWSVEIPRVPPKPLLMPLTANYRRTPVLQIGADIYCDSQNIAHTLAERGHSSRVFGSQAPGAVMSLAAWVEQTVFALAVRLVITDALDTAPSEFIQDRGDLYFGKGWTSDQLRQEQTSVALELHGHLAYLESMLLTTPYLGGSTASLSDAAAASVVWFLKARWSNGLACLAAFPRLVAVLDTLEGLSLHAVGDLRGEDALQIALMSCTGTEPELSDWASALGYTLGSTVRVRPAGESSDPDVIGSLRALSDLRISLDHWDPQVGDVVIHFPLPGYRVELA